MTGLGGLYQLLSTKSDGAIVRNLADNTTKFISARLHNVTPLESIEIYTTGANVRLHEVLQKMKESDTPRPDTKKGSNEEIKSYFRSVYPELDEERVYTSDMKKMVKWYELLQTNDLLDFSKVQQQQEEETAGNEGAETTAEASAQVAENKKGEAPEVALLEDAEKPAKKARAKKAAEPVAETANLFGDAEEKPAKKTVAKKKKAEGEDAAAEEKPAKKTAAKKKKEEE